MFLVPRVWSKIKNSPWSKLMHCLVLVFLKLLVLVPILSVPLKFILH